jgi:hypothetical protein
MVTPMNPDSISRATSIISSRYACYFNRAYKRTSNIRDGRHRTSFADDQFLESESF